jgi:hypothetical protein
VAEFNYKKAFYYSRRDVFVLKFYIRARIVQNKSMSLKLAENMVSSGSFANVVLVSHIFLFHLLLLNTKKHEVTGN